MKKSTQGTEIKFREVTYPSIASLAKAFNRPIATVFQRLKRGCTTEQALDLEPVQKKTSGEEFIVKGITYPSRASAARAHGLCPKIVHGRIKKGYSLEEVFGFKEISYSSKVSVAASTGNTKEKPQTTTSAMLRL